VTGNSTQQQRQVAAAIKVAREMALLPYSSRVTTQRGRPRRDDDGERRPRRDRDAPSEEFAEIGGSDSADSLGYGENGPDADAGVVGSGEVVQSAEVDEVVA
jgi:small subunit ribosomal protein S18